MLQPGPSPLMAAQSLHPRQERNLCLGFPEHMERDHQDPAGKDVIQFLGCQ